MREQRLVFGEAAALYDRARAGYPDAVIDDVVAFVGRDGPATRALEIGAGTGKATVPFAARGFEIVALEPSPEMAAMAIRNCRTFPRVRVEPMSFEDYAIEPGAFDLVFSAQAWHWVRRDVRAAKGALALTPGGALALFWHRTDWHGEELRDELEALYRRRAPELFAQDPGFPGLSAAGDDERPAYEIAASELFGDPILRTHRWSAELTADGFVELCLTQSNHRLLADQLRAELLDEVHALVLRHDDHVVVRTPRSS